MAETAPQRLYLGNLPRNATKQDIENYFSKHGTGELVDVKLMSGFGFVEYNDASDVQAGAPGEPHPTLHEKDFMGDPLVVQYARGQNRPPRDDYQQRAVPRPRRTVHKMTISGLPGDASWQDLKDFARQPGLDVVYSEVSRDRNNPGSGFVEYESAEDLAKAVEKLDGSDFKGGPVQCISDPHAEIPRGPPQGPPRERYDRFRSRSPPPRRGGYGGYGGGYGGGHGGHGGYGGGYGAPRDGYDHRRGQSPRRYNDGGYRDRSPPRGGDRDGRDHYDRRGPPRDFGGRPDGPRPSRPPPMDGGSNGYGASRGGRYPQDDSYGGAPPRRGGGGGGGYPDEPFSNGNNNYGGGQGNAPAGGQGGYQGGSQGGHGREPYGGRPSSPSGRRERGGYGGGDDYRRNY